MPKPPLFTVLAGPNGSGKSTLATYLANQGHPFGFMVNPDDIILEIKNSGKQFQNFEFEAGRLAIERTRNCIADRTSFTRETTLSSHEIFKAIKHAKLSGFEICFIFICLLSLEQNIDRVAERVLKGGHDIPLKAQNRRYIKSIENAPKAIRLADKSLLFDNSGDGHVLVGEFRGMQCLHADSNTAPWMHMILSELT